MLFRKINPIFTFFTNQIKKLFFLDFSLGFAFDKKINKCFIMKLSWIDGLIQEVLNKSFG